MGHATFCIVIVYNNAIARLRRVSGSVEEAAADLGADQCLTFRTITLPGLRSAILAGALLAFASSFDEVIVTIFTAGGVKTLPIWIFQSFRLANQLPLVNVAGVSRSFCPWCRSTSRRASAPAWWARAPDHGSQRRPKSAAIGARTMRK